MRQLYICHCCGNGYASDDGACTSTECKICFQRLIDYEEARIEALGDLKVGDRIEFAYDSTTGTMWLAKNGTWIKEEPPPPTAVITTRGAYVVNKDGCSLTDEPQLSLSPYTRYKAPRF